MIYLAYSPLTWLLVSVAWLLLCLRHPTRVRLRRLGGAALSVSIVLMTPAAANLLMAAAERGAGLATVTPCTASDETLPVVLLSAGFKREAANVDDVAALGDENWTRIAIAVAAWREAPQVYVVAAGGGPYAIAESSVLSSAMRQAGVPRGHIIGESRSTTTWESAFELRHLVNSRVRVATSRDHQARASLAFHAAGLDSCAVRAPTEVRGPDSLGYWLPQTAGLRKAERAIYELLGLGLYKVRGLGRP